MPQLDVSHTIVLRGGEWPTMPSSDEDNSPFQPGRVTLTYYFYESVPLNAVVVSGLGERPDGGPGLARKNNHFRLGTNEENLPDWVRQLIVQYLPSGWTVD